MLFSGISPIVVNPVVKQHLFLSVRELSTLRDHNTSDARGLCRSLEAFPVRSVTGDSPHTRLDTTDVWSSRIPSRLVDVNVWVDETRQHQLITGVEHIRVTVCDGR